MYMYVLEKRGQEKFQLSLSLFYKNKVFKRHVDKKVSEKTIKKTGFVKSSFITRREGICIKIGQIRKVFEIPTLCNQKNQN